MHIKMLEEMETRAKFLVTDASPEKVNALRRALIMDVPKLAIDDVEFHLGSSVDAEGNEYESISPVFDEIVAHRLGLVPIPTDLELFGFRDQCTCGGEGCPSCTIYYSLEKRGPCEVYSGDLSCLGDAKFQVKDQLIPIVRLGERQGILAYAIAELGTGRKHAKWQPTHGVGYKYFPTVTIDQSKCDNGGTCVKVCPKEVMNFKDQKVQVLDNDACVLCEECVKVCRTGAITVKWSESKFLFEFETDGSLSARVALTKALESLEMGFDEFREKVASLEG
ncbi:MAG TPA: DNA-directed RNA polymerase subunit D [Methanomassiliicoccales archaeon]|jgi:DNA-directed RNA polymerase subunit D|nr:DNA-directed RNA polymerase subunit D [Methanomassiliicoccales archaeon]